MVIDTHCHLNDEIYTDLDRIINEMQSDNLEKIVCASAGFETSKRAVEIANNNANIFAMIGLHPENIDEYSPDFEKFILENGKNKKVVAIGEIGLDYHYENYDKEKQKEVLLKQLSLAHALSLPVVFHVRDAHEDFLKLLKQNKNLIQNGGIVHCFSGSTEIANEYIKLGLKIAFGGVLTFTNAKKATEVAKNIAIENIVVETDAPWLCPSPFRGQRNEPKYINYVVQKLADIKQMQKDKVEKILLENTYNVFPKMK